MIGHPLGIDAADGRHGLPDILYGCGDKAVGVMVHLSAEQPAVTALSEQMISFQQKILC